MATIWVSATGNNTSFEEKKKVLIQRQGNGVFIQTDKPIYNPGQEGKRPTDRIQQKTGQTVAHIQREGLCGWVRGQWNKAGGRNVSREEGSQVLKTRCVTSVGVSG